MVHREYFNPQWFCSHKNPTDCSGQGAWYLFVVYVVYLVVNKVVASKSGQVDDDGVDHCAGTPHSPLAAPRRDVLHLERVIDEARAARAELKLHVTCSHEKGNGRSIGNPNLARAGLGSAAGAGAVRAHGGRGRPGR